MGSAVDYQLAGMPHDKVEPGVRREAKQVHRLQEGAETFVMQYSRCSDPPMPRAMFSGADFAKDIATSTSRSG